MKHTHHSPRRQSAGITFAIDPNNDLFVKVRDAAIPPWILLVESLETIVFPDEKNTLYLPIDVVIRWHRRELAYAATDDARRLHDLAARAFTAAKEKHAAGAVSMEVRRA